MLPLFLILAAVSLSTAQRFIYQDLYFVVPEVFEKFTKCELLGPCKGKTIISRYVKALNKESDPAVQKVICSEFVTLYANKSLREEKKEDCAYIVDHLQRSMQRTRHIFHSIKNNTTIDRATRKTLKKMFIGADGAEFHELTGKSINLWRKEYEDREIVPSSQLKELKTIVQDANADFNEQNSESASLLAKFRHPYDSTRVTTERIDYLREVLANSI